MARARALGSVVAAVTLVSCVAFGPPQLVRDQIGLFSAEARAMAEGRLRELAGESGVWVFIVTDAEGDPPRMLDAPMGEADDAGVPAVAVLFGPNGLAGAGLSERANPSFASLDFVAVDQAVQAGDADGALEASVDRVIDWVTSGMPRENGGPPIAPQPT